MLPLLYYTAYIIRKILERLIFKYSRDVTVGYIKCFFKEANTKSYTSSTLLNPRRRYERKSFWFESRIQQKFSSTKFKSFRWIEQVKSTT